MQEEEKEIVEAPAEEAPVAPEGAPNLGVDVEEEVKPEDKVG